LVIGARRALRILDDDLDHVGDVIDQDLLREPELYDGVLGCVSDALRRGQGVAKGVGRGGTAGSGRRGSAFHWYVVAQTELLASDDTQQL
jgi:hypothetical protein